MSRIEKLFTRFLNTLTDKEKEEVENELDTMDINEVTEEIAEDIVDTVGDENNAEAEDDDAIDDAEAEDDDAIDDAEDSDIDSEDGADDVQAGVEAEGEAPEAEAESEAEAEVETEPEVEGEDNVDAEAEVETEPEVEGEDNVDAEAEVAETDDDAEAERIDGKRLTEIEAKIDMIIQMLTTSGPDGTHVPFVNIPGRSHYHDDMDLGEATRVLLTGKF